MYKYFFRTKNTIFYRNYLSQISSTAELVESYFLPCIWRMIRDYVQGRLTGREETVGGTVTRETALTEFLAFSSKQTRS